ncbi:hypothetical protein HAX54_026961 [Datura stramonium]|uniref:Uncharacterized protein n=1 Tax=Datura stramonium TaxID=4076 RepID=A0ABS8V326_DATST|nr:hypothetical protein [Datura stramonium]
MTPKDTICFFCWEAVTLTQDVAKTMLSQGYVLGKGALGKAKAFDESHGLSATAVSKVADLSERTASPTSSVPGLKWPGPWIRGSYFPSSWMSSALAKLLKLPLIWVVGDSTNESVRAIAMQLRFFYMRMVLVDVVS